MEAFVRLENRDATKGHNKFYEMRLVRASGGYDVRVTHDVRVTYGRIGAAGKEIMLKGARGSLYDAKEAFLKQLRIKFAKKEYSLVDHRTSDKTFEGSILATQGIFEGETQLMERLAERDF